MVLRANSPQKVNALACNTRRLGLILCCLLGWTLFTAASPTTLDSHNRSNCSGYHRAKEVVCFSQGFGNRFPVANSWDRRSKLMFGGRPFPLSMQNFRQKP
jgi:hypothetical protein